MKKLAHEEILAIREKNRGLERNPIAICLNNIRSLYNVGSIFRIADGIRAEKIYLCGITGKPPHRAITKAALGAEESVPWEYHPNAVLLLERLKSIGYEIAVMEHTDESISYAEAKFHFPVCLVVGNEVTGVDPEGISLANLAVEIPMLGEKNSLNVAVATGIVGCHVLLGLRKADQSADFCLKELERNGF
jgi:tRNA G18 (ribose-2'-O)-methylase SpoU